MAAAISICGWCHNIKWLPNHKLTSSANHSTKTRVYRIIKCRMVTFGSGELHSVVWFATILLTFELNMYSSLSALQGRGEDFMFCLNK